jgi:hypothetical protein
VALKSRISTYAHPKYRATTNNEVLLFIIYPICFVQHDGLFTYISWLNNLCFFRRSLQNHICVWSSVCQISIWHGSLVGKQGLPWEAPQHTFMSNTMAFHIFQPPFWA